MKKNNSGMIIFIIFALAVIIAVVSVFSSNKTVNMAYSKLWNIIEAGAEADENGQQVTNDSERIKEFKKNTNIQLNITSLTINSVKIDGYNVIVSMTYKSTASNNGKETTNTVTYSSTYSRANSADQDLRGRLDAIGVTYSYTDPNAGSFWSYLVPVICVGLAIVALIFIMRASGGGTKGAMNFAKLSVDSFAMDFGETSPKMRTTTVDTAVDIPAPFDGNHSTKSRVAIEASRIFTMLFPISIVERSAS